jgi:2-hydroxychromene-2-carboxylate isomerase
MITGIPKASSILTGDSIIPVFLGGINVGSGTPSTSSVQWALSSASSRPPRCIIFYGPWPLLGNKPPWTLPAKAVYGQFDSARSKRYFGLPNIKTPEFFPILSLLPQRALVYIKEAHPQSFVEAFLDIFDGMWESGLDVSKPELLGQVLSKKFSEAEVKDILEKANSAPYKQRLNDNTKEALDTGAFGCPWHVVCNSKGESEPFFGSDRCVSLSLFFFWRVHDSPFVVDKSSLGIVPGAEEGCLRWRANCETRRTRLASRAVRWPGFRFHYMWEFLGLPWKDVELQAPGEAITKAKI